MASWSQTFSINSAYSITLNATEASQDTANNRSTINYSLVMATDPGSFTGYSDYKTTISITLQDPSGTTSTLYSYSAARDFNPSAASSYTETLKSGTATVTHLADGTGSVKFSASVSVASGTYSPGSASLSNRQLDLTTIPRASTITNGTISVTIGSTTSIGIAAASNTFKHKLRAVVGSTGVYLNSGNYLAAGVTTYAWTPSSGTWSGEFANQTSKTGTLTLYTYDSSNNLIGSNAYSFTMSVPSGDAPTASISLAPVNANAWINSKGIYVSGYTKIQATVGGTPPAGASIQSYTISNAFNKTITTSATSTVSTSGILTVSGTSSQTKTVALKVTDSRGKSATASASCTYQPYTAPSVSSISYNRGTYSGGVWTSSDSGTDLRIVFKGKCSLTASSNQLKSWSVSSTPAGVTGSGSNLASNTSQTVYKTGIGTTTRYEVKVTVTDEVGNSATRTISVPQFEIPFVIDLNKPAVGIGAVPQSSRTLEVGQSWKITQAGYEIPRMAFAERSNNTQITIGIDSNTRMAIYTMGAYAAARGGGVVICNSSGSVYQTMFNSPSGIGLTTSTNQLTIANTSGGYAYIVFLVFAGNISIP